VVKQEGLQQLQ